MIKLKEIFKYLYEKYIVAPIFLLYLLCETVFELIKYIIFFIILISPILTLLYLCFEIYKRM